MFKLGDKIKSTFTGYGLMFGKEYIVIENAKVASTDFVLIRNDEGLEEYYDEGYFELVSK